MDIDVTLQPHLGRPHDRYKPGDNLGTLAIAKVLKVHHKSGTVDLQLVKTNTVVSSPEENEGKFSARVMTTTAHFDPVTVTSSGVIEPMQEGQLVLLAYVDGLQSQPVILGSFHQTFDSEKNILPEYYPLNPDNSVTERKEALKYLRVHPSQFYERIDGIGSKEVSHPSKTFLQIEPDVFEYGEKVRDTHGGYDHKDLNERNPLTGESRFGIDEETLFPVNVLFVHRSDADDEQTTWTKLFIDASGMLRVTRDNNDGTLSFLELSQKGGITFRRQTDSPLHHGGKNFSEISLAESGGISLGRTIEGNRSDISIDEQGDIVLTHKDGASTKFTKYGMDSGAGSGSLISVSSIEPEGVGNNHLWVDISDLEEVQ